MKKLRSVLPLSVFCTISLCICLLFGCSLFPSGTISSTNTSDSESSLQPQSLSDSAFNQKLSAKFDKYLDVLFQNEVSSNTLNMHYTLSNPENYGITDYNVTLGHISHEAENDTLASLENIQSVLSGYNYEQLSLSDQLTFDILNDYASNNLATSGYYLYDEILRPNTGFQAEYPILLTEYRFDSKQDILNYLDLLSLTDEYFGEIISFEQEKSVAGLFMSDYAADAIISECSALCEPTTDEHYLVTTFNDKLDTVSGLSEDEKTEYMRKNKALVEDSLLPAYSGLADSLSILKETGTNDKGLSYLPKGKSYYCSLVYASTGSPRTIEELESLTDAKREKDLLRISELTANNPNISTEANAFSLDTSSPEEVLNYLLSAISSDFPVPPDTDFTVSYVDECMQESMAPAFYLTAPIDDLTHNSIYINPANGYEGLQLFTTLAHEGFPGHLYQTIMSYHSGISPIRNLLNYPGYAEGWATYVELMSYKYAGLTADAAELLSCNQSAILSLYASTDMGIHYDGWTLSDTIKFFSGYGITDADAITNIYQYIIEEPAHYLKYYIGYVEILALKDKAKTQFGADYSDSAFHKAILDIGPAPFSILEKYLPAYYEK